MPLLHDFARAVLPALAFGLLSATVSFPPDSAPGQAIPAGPGLVGTTLEELARPDPPSRAEEIARLRPIIERAARRHGLDPLLLHAVIRAESGYDANAQSARGAVGLMQLLPATARRYGADDLLDPRKNVDAGARYLRHLLALFEDDLELALAGYNAGESAVLRAGRRVPDYPQTLAYVPKVLGFYRAAGGG